MASVERRSKNSFRLIVEAGYDANGNRIKKSRTIKCKTKKEALLELAKFQIEVESGEYISPEKMYFSLFVNEWRDKYAKKNLAVKTIDSHLDIIKNHIMPAFKNMKLDAIKTMHIINLLDSLHNDEARKDGKPGPLADSSIYQVDKVLRNIFQRAVEWKLIKQHPMKDLRRPRVKKKEMKYLDSS